MNLEKILYAVGALVLGLVIMATVSPELFTIDQLLKALPQFLEMLGAK